MPGTKWQDTEEMAVKARFYRTIYSYHTILGLFVSIHLVVLLGSGLILLFKDTIQHPNHDAAKTSVGQDILEQNKVGDNLDRVHENLLRLYPKDRPLDIYPDDHNPQIIRARLGMEGSNKLKGARLVSFDYDSGQEIKVEQLPASAFYDWILTLHQQLFMGQRGQLYIGLVGVAFILMNITGLLMFLKKPRKKLSPKIDTTRFAKAKYTDVHQYLGVISLCWGLIVGITGTFLALNPLFTKQFQETTLKQLAEKYQHQQEINKPDVTLKAVINTAFKAKQDGVIWYMVFPGMERGLQGHYLVLVHGQGLFSQYVSEYLVISAKTAELKEVIQLPTFMQLALISTPFHFVNYGGMELKILWSLFAICTLSLTFLGITISYHRRKLAYV